MHLTGFLQNFLGLLEYQYNTLFFGECLQKLTTNIRVFSTFRDYIREKSNLKRKKVQNPTIQKEYIIRDLGYWLCEKIKTGKKFQKQGFI